MTAAVQQSVAVRNAKLDAIEAAILAAGGQPHFKIHTGAMPASCATARTGTTIADITMPADPFAGASAGSKAMQGTWQDADADGTGFGGYFSILDSGGSCHLQGLVSMAYIANFAVPAGLQMHNGTHVYAATTGGTTGASSPPTTTGSGITDGSVTWNYLGEVGAVIDNDSIVIHQVVNVTAFTIQDNNG